MKNELSAFWVMRTVLGFFAIGFFSVSHTMAQGNLNFSNFGGDGVNAPVTFADGTGVSKGYKAQIYAGLPNTPAGSLTPVLPTTTFRENVPGYISPLVLYVPDIGAGQFATVQMRAYNGADWETSLCRGESNLLTILLGGGTGLPPSLVGLEPFQVVCIPEPGTTFIFCVGLGLIGVWRIRRES